MTIEVVRWPLGPRRQHRFRVLQAPVAGAQERHPIPAGPGAPVLRCAADLLSRPDLEDPFRPDGLVEAQSRDQWLALLRSARGVRDPMGRLGTFGAALPSLARSRETSGPHPVPLGGATADAGGGVRVAELTLGDWVDDLRRLFGIALFEYRALRELNFPWLDEHLPAHRRGPIHLRVLVVAPADPPSGTGLGRVEKVVGGRLLILTDGAVSNARGISPSRTDEVEVGLVDELPHDVGRVLATSWGKTQILSETETGPASFVDDDAPVTLVYQLVDDDLSSLFGPDVCSRRFR